ncbi:MAG: phosphatase PAP2 family protein [Chloroflexota bacterium]
MAAIAEAARRHSVIAEWLAFATQVLIAVSFEVADDLGRGLVAQHGTLEGNDNALSIVAFERAHGFWVEPAWQIFFEHTHSFLTFTMSWPDAMRIMNSIYVGGHVFVTLGVAIWLFAYRRRIFGFVRNVVILTNLFALVVYERFPVAPPRLTYPLWFHHHPFHFQDTVFGLVSSTGKLMGTQAGYNEYSAMPSVHMAWALIAGACVLLLARSPFIRTTGIIYPMMMLVAVVVTGNHYLMDVVGAVPVVLIAVIVALGMDRCRNLLPGGALSPRPVDEWFPEQ